MSSLNQIQSVTTNPTDTDTDINSIYSEHDTLFPSKDGSRPSFASEKPLSRGLQIPSRSSRLTSGFEYSSVLPTCSVSQEDWSRFTNEIIEASKLSPSQWRAVIGVGIGAMAIGGMMLGIFGAIPAVFAARQKRVNQEYRNLANAMGLTPSSSPPQSQKGERGSSLLYKINQWNETFFKPRGILIRIHMPYDISALKDGLDVAGQVSQGSVFRMPTEKTTSQKQRYKASKRARIIIIPLNQRQESVVKQLMAWQGESPYISATYD